MKNLLPTWLFEIITKNYLSDYINEIRIRLNKPIIVCYKGKYEILRESNDYNLRSIYANSELINNVLSVATKQSFYAYNNQIKHGYITTDSGIRIGLCGSVVMNENSISTIRDITSLNIRFSHKVNGCSKKILDLICLKENVRNTLIISPPGAGKTTMIRDIASWLSNDKKINNILVVDERFEIAGSTTSYSLLDGDFIDVISGSEKHFAFKEGIKSMNPSVIITDEISEYDDFKEILEVSKCGVKIIATAHASNIEDIKRRPSFKNILDNKIFERIVLLSKRCGAGTIEAVFDENFKGLYFHSFNI